MSSARQPPYERLEGEGFGEIPAQSMFPGQHTVSLRKTRPGGAHPPNADVETGSSSGASLSAHFLWKGVLCHATLDSAGVAVVPPRGWMCRLRDLTPLHVPYSKMLSATTLERLPLLPRVWRLLRRKKGAVALAIHTCTSKPGKSANLRYLRLIFIIEDAAIARGWVAEINGIVRTMSASRPARLLVLLNPKGGSGRAAKVWHQEAQPILRLAGVECMTQMTEYAQHGQEVVANLSLQDLESLDGILAVGGDGLFQEVVNGILALRRGGGPRAVVALSVRLAQIPAGSTDAVAWTLNGTRSVETAALRVAFGDRLSLDAMRVDSGDAQCRYSVCYASYGYMGDLMRQSERLRWLGPLRYTLAGAIVYLQGKTYSAHISCVPAPQPGVAEAPDGVCNTGCSVCAAMEPPTAAQNQFANPASDGLKGHKLLEFKGRFRSIMAIVTPCRSDLSPSGLSSGSHLADGRIRLIMVKECSQIQYLRFLASIPGNGLRPGGFNFVEVVDVSALRVSLSGQQSSWNVDGELLQTIRLEASVHRGLLQVFSKGVPA